MLSEKMLKELENEFKDTIGLETLSKSFISKIKASGLRLSQEEKETLAFHYLNFNLDLNDENKKVEIVLSERKSKKEFLESEKQIKRFEKALGRLAEENMDGFVHNSDFYHYERIMGGISYMGASEYAKYYYYTYF